MMKLLSSIIVLVSALSAAPALAAVYLTGSVSASSANAGLMGYESRGGSASIAVDLGRFMRLGVTHRQQIAESKGFVGSDDDLCENVSKSKPAAEGECVDYESRTHVIANSVDLTVILYDGQVFVPFLMGGGVVKTYSSETTKADEVTVVKPTTYGPVPNVGGGLGIKLNKEFQLKITYTASPGVTVLPDGTTRSVWDRDTSIGISYQF